jgi:hypothetical protein
MCAKCRSAILEIHEDGRNLEQVITDIIDFDDIVVADMADPMDISLGARR